jgi:putative addiction module killer protein
MLTIQQTETFTLWFSSLRDARAKARIIMRLDRVRAGNLGDVKSVGNQVYEMRVDVGPGYRLYYTQRGKTILLLLCGGDKSTQPRDIKRATVLAQELWP